MNPAISLRCLKTGLLFLAEPENLLVITEDAYAVVTVVDRAAAFAADAPVLNLNCSGNLVFGGRRNHRELEEIRGAVHKLCRTTVPQARR